MSARVFLSMTTTFAAVAAAVQHDGDDDDSCDGSVSLSPSTHEKEN